jgi:hypothetical protein
MAIIATPLVVQASVPKNGTNTPSRGRTFTSGRTPRMPPSRRIDIAFVTELFLSIG